MLKPAEVSFPLERVRADFPILERRVHGKQLVYLDNAATTQKPKCVIDAISRYYSEYNSNIHRSVHELAEEATEAFENTRSNLRSFINTPSASEIIFTRNATEALNLAARGLSETLLKKGDKVVVTEMEHHSNFVPWQQFASKVGAKLEIVSVDTDCFIDEGDLESKLEGAKIFAFPHMSNVLGTVNDANKYTKMAHRMGCVVVVDGAQSAPHMPIDVSDMDCDFFAISAHKMLGPTGFGCLYGKLTYLEQIPPLLFGGDMIKEVHRDHTLWNDLPWKFEAGTSNIAGAIGFSAALDYLRDIGMENVWEHERRVCAEAMSGLGKIDRVRLYGPPDVDKRGAVISFNVGDIHAHDVASVLDTEGIAIRSGHHCAQVLMEKLDLPGTSRASFYLYNGLDDVESLCRGIKHVKKVLS